MRIRILGSTSPGSADDQFLISYLCNETVAIDAGCLGLLAPVSAQLQVAHVFLSHSHIDHTASLPIFLDNVFNPGPECVRIHALPETIQSLQSDIFNDRVWPDFVELSVPENRFLNFSPLATQIAVRTGGLTITPVAINHVIPTVAFIVDDGVSAVGIVSDTGPTETVWDILRGEPRLKAVFLEASFPNELGWLADKSGHLTPRLFQREIRKLSRDIEIIAIHLKPRHRATLLKQLGELELPRLSVGRVNHDYTF